MIRKFLRVLAVLLAVFTLGFWLYAGANTGWTKTSVAETKIDPITEIEYQEYQSKFVPGVEFLFVNGLLALGLAAASFLPIFNPKTRQK